jgi:hypothetical protein
MNGHERAIGKIWEGDGLGWRSWEQDKTRERE